MMRCLTALVLVLAIPRCASIDATGNTDSSAMVQTHVQSFDSFGEPKWYALVRGCHSKAPDDSIALHQEKRDVLDGTFNLTDTALGQVTCCDDSKAYRLSKADQCYSDKPDKQLFTYYQAEQICAKDSRRVCTSIDTVDKSCGNDCQGDFSYTWIDVSMNWPPPYYEMTGKGQCVGSTKSGGLRIRLSGVETNAYVNTESKYAKQSERYTAAQCSIPCLHDDTCIGYYTTLTKCGRILSTTSNHEDTANGIVDSDGEADMWCWKKLLAPEERPTPSPTPRWWWKTSNAKGDPHVTNVKGERFDIMKTGSISMLHIPQGSPTPGLTVQAEIIPVRMLHSDKCLRYIKSLSIAGSWLKASRQIEFVAGGIEKRGPRSDSAGFKVRVGDGKWHDTTFVKKFESLKAADIGSKATCIHGKFCEVLMELGGVKVRVWQNSKNFNTADKEETSVYLNLAVNQLSHVQDSIGGVLGLDDHSDIVIDNTECPKSAASLFRQDVSRDDIEAIEDGQSVISASM